MRITCPECTSEFDVPDNAIPEKGRKLRCSQCQHKWHQRPVAAEPEPALKPALKPQKAKEVVSDDAGDEISLGADDAWDGDDESTGDKDPGEDDHGSMFGSGERDADADDDFDAPPIPRRDAMGNYTAPSRRARNIVIVAAVIFLLVVPGVLVGTRTPLVAALPALSPLFDVMGLHVAVPGEALVIQNVGAWRKTEGGVERMLIQGQIRNDTDTMQSVPVIRAVLLDSGGAELQSAPYTPEAALLVPGESLSFTYQIPNPGPNADWVTINFSDEQRQGGFGY